MKFMTAGESHGRGLVGILEGMPANLKLDIPGLNAQLARRQTGYGRGGRMKIEADAMEIYAGVRGGVTLGSPVAFVIENRDYENWRSVMGAETARTDLKTLTAVRPGHADLAGCIKYAQHDARNVLERASARETAVRVGIGAFCRQLLGAAGIEIGSHVTEIAGITSGVTPDSAVGLNDRADKNPVRCLDESAGVKMMKRIDECRLGGDTAGGEAEILVSGLPVGIGSYASADRRLDYILSGHLMGIQAVKSVSIGAGERVKSLSGSRIHDPITLSEDGRPTRKTNRAGGIEGGVSNGENLVLRIGVKPIPTLMQGLDTVDIRTGKAAKAAAERSDVCAVPAAGVVAEAVVAFALCDALLAVTGGDTAEEVVSRTAYLRQKHC